MWESVGEISMRIKSISINNFRSIENQVIENIGNSLILIGKNNSGKSSALTCIRAFFNKYQIQEKDFPPDVEEIQIKISFEIEEDYFQDYIFDQKLGISKFPSNAGDFNNLKVDTSFSGNNFNDYKQERDEVLNQFDGETDFHTTYSDIYGIWLRCLKEKCKIEDNLLIVTAKIQKNELKVNYYDSDDNEIKFIASLFPEISYIHDERNFSEEEAGKTNTLTLDLFTNKILNKHRNSRITCNTCYREVCDECFCQIKEKSVEDLTADDLEKLIQVKLKEISQEVSETISVYFRENYQENYSIRISPQCNINKSVYGISTKIRDPNIQKELDISNVGAGLRNIYNLSLLQAYNKLYGSDSPKNQKTIYMLEEPEIYLHPSLQKEMCSILHEISQNNQIFFTTHSPLLLKNFDATHIRKTKLNCRFKTEISTTNLSEILNEIGYSTADLLQTEYTIICEGQNDKERISQVIEKFYDVDLRNIFFIEARSCSNIETYATIKFLDRTELKDRFTIIRDSDTEDVQKIKDILLNKYRENLGAAFIDTINERILVLKYSALECYFLNPEVLSTLGIVDCVDTFYTRIDNYINNNRTSIENYIKEHNEGKDERIHQLLQEIYGTSNREIKIEFIKKNVRGHNLFGLFGPQIKNKLQRYIKESTPEDFKEIVDFLDKFTYFEQKKKAIYSQIHPHQSQNISQRSLFDY